MPFRIRGHSTFETGHCLSLPHLSFPQIYLQVTFSHPLHTNTHLIKTNLWSSYSHGYSIIKIHHFTAPYGYNRISPPLINSCSTSLTLPYPRNSFLGEKTKLHLLSQWSSRENEIAQHITASIQQRHMFPLEIGWKMSCQKKKKKQNS